MISYVTTHFCTHTHGFQKSKVPESWALIGKADERNIKTTESRVLERKRRRKTGWGRR